MNGIYLSFDNAPLQVELHKVYHFPLYILDKNNNFQHILPVKNIKLNLRYYFVKLRNNRNENIILFYFAEI